MDTLRIDRNRYVGFAFAAADLLLEVDLKGSIRTAQGASQSLWGWDARELTGLRFSDLVVDEDRLTADRLLRAITDTGRLDPVVLRLRRKSGAGLSAVMGGCSLPTLRDTILITLLMQPTVIPPPDEARRDLDGGLLGRDRFLGKLLGGWNAGTGLRRLTLFRIEGLSSAMRTLPEDRTKVLMQEIAASLRARSIGADTAGRLGEEAFGYVPNRASDGEDPAILSREIGLAAEAAGIVAGCVRTATSVIDLSPGELNEEDAARALAFSVKEFAQGKVGTFTLRTLADGLKQAMAQTMGRFASLQQLIQSGGFSLVYQPIVLLDDRQVHHYEALSRFPGGASPADTVGFGEEIGLAEMLDLAVCRKAIGELTRLPSAQIAVNLSGRSIQNARFREMLGALLAEHPAIGKRLIFELTESSSVDHLAEAANFLQWLRRLGHLICLDDFGAGAAAYSYLRHFDVNFIKIDGPFLKLAAKGGREAVLVRSIARLAKDLGCGVVGEMIEDEETASAAATMGIDFGQGWLFGKPVAAIPEPERPMPRVKRRKGYTDTWS